jgi:hypothetical protein
LKKGRKGERKNAREEGKGGKDNEGQGRKDNRGRNGIKSLLTATSLLDISYWNILTGCIILTGISLLT